MPSPSAYNDVEFYGGGFDIRAETVRVNPVPDMREAVNDSSELNAADFEVIADQSLVAIEARQVSTENEFADYPLRGLDDRFFDSTTYGMAAIAEGYTTPAGGLGRRQDDSRPRRGRWSPAPRRDNFDFGQEPTDFQVEGFFVEDATFAPFDVEVRDPITGKQTTLTVIGVLPDVVPAYMIGLSTSQSVVEETFPEQAQPNAHLIKLAARRRGRSRSQTRWSPHSCRTAWRRSSSRRNSLISSPSTGRSTTSSRVSSASA